MEIAEDDGYILYNKNNILIFYYKNQKKIITRQISPSKKLINYSLDLKYLIKDKKFKKGDVLYDYTNINPENKMPKIGYRANILFAHFMGYTADDAIVISEGFAKRTLYYRSEKYYLPIVKTWKYFRLKRIAEFIDPEDEVETYLPLEGEKIKDGLIQYQEIDTTDHFFAEIANNTNKQSKFFSKKIEGILNGNVEKIKFHIFNQNVINEMIKIKYIYPVLFDKKIEKLPEDILNNVSKIQDPTLKPLKVLYEVLEDLNNKYIYNPGLINELKKFIVKNINDEYSIYISFREIGMTNDKTMIYLDQISDQYLYMKKLFKHYKQMFNEEFHLKDYDNIDFLLEVDNGITTRTTRGDKFTNLFAGKATVAMIIPDHLMPINPNTGKPYDLIFNTLGIPGRNNWGTIFEALLSKIIFDIEKTAKEANEDYQETIDLLKEKINFINENFIKKYDQEYYNQVNALINNYYKVDQDGIPLYKKFIQDINNEGFYLYVPNFPDISYKEIYKEFAEPYAEKFNPDLFKKSKITYKKELFDWLREKWKFKEPFELTFDSEIEAMDGWNYILKLHHTSNSKYNSVSFTTSYSKVTGQPVRGRKKNGGGHISWQSLAALLAHKENNAILKELYTIKSDALDEKRNFILKFIRDGEYHLKDNYYSVTKKTLNNALKILGMKFEN